MNQASSPNAGQPTPAPATAAALIGCIDPFDASANDWGSYPACLEQYLDANSIREQKNVATLLILIGGPTYQLVRILVAQADPKTKSFDELTAALTQHFFPWPSRHCRTLSLSQARPSASSWRDGGNLRIARYCDFSANLDLSLRDRFVCGLKNEAVIKKLLQEKDLDLPKAITIVTATEIASRDAAELGRGSTMAAQVHNIRKQRPLPKTSSSPSRENCFRCGRMGHTLQNCKCKEMDCLQCGKRCHIARACDAKNKNLAVMEQTPAITGPARAVKDTRLGGRRLHALQPFCLICKRKADMVEPTINGTPLQSLTPGLFC